MVILDEEYKVKQREIQLLESSQVRFFLEQIDCDEIGLLHVKLIVSIT